MPGVLSLYLFRFRVDAGHERLRARLNSDCGGCLIVDRAEFQQWCVSAIATVLAFFVMFDCFDLCIRIAADFNPRLRATNYVVGIIGDLVAARIFMYISHTHCGGN